jgi:hypothetical protein
MEENSSIDISGLSLKEKRDLLAQLIEKQNREPRYELLSLTQQRLWFFNQLEPNSSAYNIPVAYRLTGHLNINVLEQSLNEIVCRQEILRTTFTSTEVEPKQVISSNIELTLLITDLQELPPDEKQKKAQQIATE